MDAADLAVTAARGVQVGASLSAFGVAVFWSVVAPPVLKQGEGAIAAVIEARLLRMFRISVAIALVSAMAWLVLNAAYIAETQTLTQTVQAIWPVVTDTRFGHVLCTRIGLLILSALALGDGARPGRVRLAAGAATVSLVLHGWQAHAAAIGGAEGTVLLGAEALHLLAAGAWLGGLLPLLIVVGAMPPQHGARAARRFTPLGLFCVAILAATAILQGWIFIGLAGLTSTGYGRIALVKLVLFVILLAIAANNRFRHTLALGSATGGDAKRRLRRSLCVEVVIAFGAVLAAAFLAGQAPARHEQPVWPFASQPGPENLLGAGDGPRAVVLRGRVSGAT
jgi:copper resistance protein D